ncbi:megakaryocyte and platelet inhibitory receptor G6b [Antechinus flavipes]|uniref:megakaryocyte and platelet inhibitory receptor G6b n=1 Tax=Antechinus flavipes TaxID=38775 RepID=UPI002235EBC9|nr:megakaryocyte and platelet inhibitory receptor G6b [Antechinus flavipes]
MVLVLGLLLLLAGTGGNLDVLLEGRPGDRVSISCTGISQATRWVWAPTYPGCIGLSPGRRPVVWASPPANLTRASTSRFAGRLRVVSPSGIQQLELLLARGDSGTFFCLGTGGRQGNESRTCLTVLGDKAACRASRPTSGSSYPLFLYPLLGIGLALGLTGLGMAWRLRQKLPSGLVRTNPARGENSSSPQLHSVTGHVPSSHPSALHPFPKTKDPSMDTEIQSRWKKETRETENLEDEKSLLYADLEHIPLRNPKNTIPKDTGTIYAIVV